MNKVFFNLGTIHERLFEVSSEGPMPDWFAHRVVKEVYHSLFIESRGTIELHVSSKVVPIKYYTKGALSHIFVPMVKEIDWMEAVASFADYIKESDLTPHTVTLKATIPTRDPESVFKLLSDNVKSFLSKISGMYGFKVEIEPEISYEGDEFNIDLSLPLDQKGLRALSGWAKENKFDLSIKEAPIEEKIRSRS